MLLLFAEFLLRSFRAPKSVTNAISSVRSFHLDLGLSVDGFEQHRLSLLKRSLPLTVRHVPARAAPLPYDVLESLCGTARGWGATGEVFAALLSCAFFAMTRLSSLVPPQGQVFDASRYPTGADVRFAGSKAWLHIKWAKAHQRADQGFWVPLLPVAGSAACPLRALSALRCVAGSSFSARPLFAVPGAATVGFAQDRCFSLRSARECLASALRAVGLRGDSFSFHSFRRGACHRAAERGASVADLQKFGGWRSAAVDLYLPEAAARCRVASSLASLSQNH